MKTSYFKHIVLFQTFWLLTHLRTRAISRIACATKNKQKKLNQKMFGQKILPKKMLGEKKMVKIIFGHKIITFRIKFWSKKMSGKKEIRL